jgi:hypothetical protein
LQQSQSSQKTQGDGFAKYRDVVTELVAKVGGPEALRMIEEWIKELNRTNPPSMDG